MSPDPPRTTHFDKSTCGFSSWYEDFKSVSIRSVIIPLPEDFVQGYLLQDGIVLPLDANGQAQPSYLHPDKDTIDHESITSESDDEDNHREISSGSSSITSNDHTMPNFPQLQEDIDEAIKSLGGHVFPKLNWSSPKDATWIATEGNLKCSNYSDVFLLLKSSDFVTHDLTCAFEAFEASTSISDSVDVSSLLSRMNIKEDGGGESILSLYGNNSSNTASTIPPTSSQTVRPRQFELILRKWCNLSRSMEFRCFVRNSQLIAITQRDYTNYYDFLVQEKDTLEDLILDFFDDHISDKFPLSNCKKECRRHVHYPGLKLPLSLFLLLLRYI